MHKSDESVYFRYHYLYTGRVYKVFPHFPYFENDLKLWNIAKYMFEGYSFKKIERLSSSSSEGDTSTISSTVGTFERI